MGNPMQNPSRDDMTKFLVEREDPKDQPRRAADLRRRGDHEIKREYLEAKNEAERRRASQLEVVNQHIQSKLEPDWRYWWGRDPWTVHEATVLSLGKDPDILTERRLSMLPLTDYFIIAYRRRLEQIKRGIAGAHFAEQIAVVKLAAWAKEKDIELNKVLLSLLPEPKGDLRAEKGVRAELEQARSTIVSLKVEIENVNKQSEKLRSDASAATLQASALREEVAYLTAENQRLGKKRPPTPRGDTKDLLLLGCAKALGFNPSTRVNPTIKTIQNELAKTGHHLDDETISNGLRHVWELIRLSR